MEKYFSLARVTEFFFPFLYFVLGAFVYIFFLNKCETVNNFSKGKKKKRPDYVVAPFYLAGIAT